MNTARNPDDVLASIRQLVAKEVRHAREREAAERPERPEPQMVSERASAAARLVLGPDARVAANGRRAPLTVPQPAPVTAAPVPAEPRAPADNVLSGLSEAGLRDMIREIIREEVRSRMGPRISEIIRKVVQQELGRLTDGQD